MNKNLKKWRLSQSKQLRKQFNLKEQLVLSLLILTDCDFITKQSYQLCISQYSSKIRNRCVISFNSKVFQSKMKISRHVARDKILNGFIPGVSKSLW